jgi:hypothetical protein
MRAAQGFRTDRSATNPKPFMKINLLKSTFGAICLALLVTAGTANAVILDVGLTDSRAIGDVINNTGPGGQESRDLYMVNTLLGVPIGTDQIIPAVGGEQFQRSSNNFGALPAAVTLGDIVTAAGGITFIGDTVSITLTSTFKYLIAAYDGPNGGAEVWDVSIYGIGTTIIIPRYAHPAVVGTGGAHDGGPLVGGDKYQMTGWSLFNPGTTSVPDGGSAIALLGMSMVGVEVLRRRFLKA